MWINSEFYTMNLIDIFSKIRLLNSETTLKTCLTENHNLEPSPYPFVKETDVATNLQIMLYLKNRKHY